MQAVTVQHIAGHRRLALSDHAEPKPGPGDALVVVKAFSLNNGEVRESLHRSDPGHRPGWDLAGVVEAAPAGSGFAAGDRVFGFVLQDDGAWAQRVAAPTRFLAALLDDVSFETAATLPIAGLTAAVALSKKPLASGQRLLVTAASGGVGPFAIQLGAAAGAHVTALVRNPEHADVLRALGAMEVAIGAEAAAAGAPYDLILEGVGGALLGKALEWLAPRGVCVLFGDAGGDEPTSFDARRFRLASGGSYGGTMLYGFFLGEEVTRPEPVQAGPILADLAGRVAKGTLRMPIGRTASWTDVDAVARALLRREFYGKGVLRINE